MTPRVHCYYFFAISPGWEGTNAHGGFSIGEVWPTKIFSLCRPLCGRNTSLYIPVIDRDLLARHGQGIVNRIRTPTAGRFVSRSATLKEVGKKGHTELVDSISQRVSMFYHGVRLPPIAVMTSEHNFS